jgi:hypothetical protein
MEEPVPRLWHGSFIPAVLFHPNAEEINLYLFRDDCSKIKVVLNRAREIGSEFFPCVRAPAAERTFVQCCDACENMKAK